MALVSFLWIGEQSAGLDLVFPWIGDQRVDLDHVLQVQPLHLINTPSMDTIFVSLMSVRTPVTMGKVTNS
jgi:hypothetical protein